MKIVLLDSSYPINYRNTKIVQSLAAAFPSYAIDVITWNRENAKIKEEHCNYKIYDKFSPVGALFRKFMNLYGYYRFIKRHISEYDIIIASHWDMLMLASILKSDKQTLIYENLDIPTSNNKLILKTLQAIERCSLRKCSAIVFASRFFEPLYDRFNGVKILLENKPLCQPQITEKTMAGDIHTIAFIGSVRYIEIMKNLIRAVENIPSVQLQIHGGGPDLQALKAFAEGRENVIFTGAYEPENIGALYSGADLIWAVYPNKDYNVKYAISNKFHESIAYHVPCLFANNTELGNFVENNGIGATVDPYDVTDISNTVTNIFNNPEVLKSLKCKIIEYSALEKDWEQQFLILTQYIQN